MFSQKIPMHTRRFTAITENDIPGIERIFTAKSPLEPRAKISLWESLASKQTGRIFWIHAKDKEEVVVNVDISPSGQSLILHKSEDIRNLIGSGPVLIDISGLPHHVWAPMLKECLCAGIRTQVAYAEPEIYKKNPNPSSASYFDLSVELGGLAPLPGFARLSGPPDEQKCLFIAMLGFEGNRPSCLILQIDPPPKVMPILGAPGFEIEYPTLAVTCNRDFFREYRVHDEHLRLARASCPFEVVEHLREIHHEYPEHYLYIAPTGTKPHALGAVMYALEREEMTEIMYDHPVGKLGRTEGIGIIHVYDIPPLLSK